MNTLVWRGPGARLAGLLLATAVLPAPPAHAQALTSSMAALDTDHDGKLDWNEIKAAADRKFASLGPDIGHNHDTLDRHKTKALLSSYMLGISDPSGDRTISRSEWEAIVHQRFRRDDTDHDGTLTQKELNTTAGQKLLRLCKS